MTKTGLAATLLMLASCGDKTEPQAQPQQTATKVGPKPGGSTSMRPVSEASLPEPHGKIDPKSVEAAGQVVQLYGALVEERRFADAAKLWRDPSAAAAFAKQLGEPDVHLEIGELGATEGAAGSIYTTIPVTFYGTGRRPASVILRRVNDVPGSTLEQRQWHIERIEWAA